MNKKISFENPEGGKIQFDVRNVSHTSCYGAAFTLHFSPLTPAATRYGENFNVQYENDTEMQVNRILVLEMIASKQEELIAEIDENTASTQNQQNFNQVAPTVGQRVDAVVASAIKLLARFKLRP